MRLAQRALDVGENRLELLVVEVQEARERFLHALLLSVGWAALSLLVGGTLVAMVAVAFEGLPALFALSGLAMVYSGGAAFFYLRLRRNRREWKVFSTTLEQLRKDRECLASPHA
jgi:uncharacterized membrane protein YqjE